MPQTSEARICPTTTKLSATSDRVGDVLHHPWNPWRELGTYADWTLRFDALPGRRRGLCHWPTRTIILRTGMTQAERRSVLGHELGHLTRGRFPGWAKPAEEESVNRWAARRLIPIGNLVEALQWTDCVDEAADYVWTDVPTVQARLRALHPSERALAVRTLERRHLAA